MEGLLLSLPQCVKTYTTFNIHGSCEQSQFKDGLEPHGWTISNWMTFPCKSPLVSTHTWPFAFITGLSALIDIRWSFRKPRNISLHLIISLNEFSWYFAFVKGRNMSWVQFEFEIRWRKQIDHYNDVIMSAMAFIQSHIKENIKAPRHWPLWGESTGNRWIPRTKGQ